MSTYTTAQKVQWALGIAWCGAVMFTYYSANAPYYAEKFSVFGEFLLSMLGVR